jgi:hypothetical protein
MFPIWHTCYNTLFNLGKNEKKRTNKFVWWWGLCKLGKGDRRSHVRLAVSQAGAILTDKSYEKGGDSERRAGYKRAPGGKWWTWNLESPFLSFFNVNASSSSSPLVDLPSRGISPPPASSSQKQQRKLDYIFSYLE